MEMFEDTIAAIATPEGIGGISVIRISGPDAVASAEKVFRPKQKSRSLSDMKGYQAVLGDIVTGDGSVLDECVALVFKAPKSYTGEDVVELQCHGGKNLPAVILRLITETGTVPAKPGEFTKRAFLNGRISLDEAEAVMRLISSTSRQGAVEAAKLLRGAAHRKLQPLKETLIRQMAEISAVIEFPEEGLEELDILSIQKELTGVSEELRRMIRNYGTGTAVYRGIPAAIVGRPNVGKSTLLNILCGSEKAIVTPIAGTTRDIVEQHVDLGGVELILSDTAGLHETVDPVEQAGVRLARRQIRETSLLIAVFDSSEMVDEEDIRLARAAEDLPSIAVINKSDLDARFSVSEIADSFDTVVVVSSLDEEATRKAVSKAIINLVGLKDIDPDEPLLANERQLSCVVRAADSVNEALQAITDGVTPDAVHFLIGNCLEAIMELTGENVSDAVIDDVFSRFCVGK